MRILVACERSGVVREAFRAKGHYAISCDLNPPLDGSIYHWQMDVTRALCAKWDMMLAFPPCTHLASSGARYFYSKKDQQRLELSFVEMLMEADIDKICIENPVGVISTRIKKPTQIVQPYQFGHDASKKTCLWLKNLPPLVPTKLVDPTIYSRFLGKMLYANQSPGNQSFERAITYQGIANAMADQWG